MADEPDKLDKFIRWQKTAINQLGYTLNLVLSFTIATLGYWFLLLKDTGFTPGSSAKCAMILSLSALSLSAILGFICIITRLVNFRGTAKRAHERVDAPPKEQLDALGTATWVVFYVELGAFAIGVVALAIALLLTFGGKLA